MGWSGGNDARWNQSGVLQDSHGGCGVGVDSERKGGLFKRGVCSLPVFMQF